MKSVDKADITGICERTKIQHSLLSLHAPLYPIGILPVKIKIEVLKIFRQSLKNLLLSMIFTKYTCISQHTLRCISQCKIVQHVILITTSFNNLLGTKYFWKISMYFYSQSVVMNTPTKARFVKKLVRYQCHQHSLDPPPASLVTLPGSINL